MEHVPEVAGVAQGQPQHQVVGEQRQQDAVVHAHRELCVAREFGEGGWRVQGQRHLHRALAFHPDEQIRRLSGRQVKLEVRMPVAHAALLEMQVIATGLVEQLAVGVAHVHVQPIAQRVLLDQQPARFLQVAIEQADVEPVGAGLETEGCIVAWQWPEASRPQAGLDRPDIGPAIAVVEIGRMGTQGMGGRIA